MKIKKMATAGTLESSDILITVENDDSNGIHIHLESPVKKQFGDQIKQVIRDTAKFIGVENAKITAIDQGALDCVIKARTSTALYRACESVDYKWEKK
ncbi:MAG: citrate lyase acyl carrier protein [Bacilli bacterium]|nr:citrate lyase acyl carrier protein [Sphaerochaetaceae bacterium]